MAADQGNSSQGDDRRPRQKKHSGPSKKGKMKPKHKSKYEAVWQEVQELEKKKAMLPEMTAENVGKFMDLPLSSFTLWGLKNAKYEVPTKVQRQSLIYSLGGCDVVAAAKTGSGKTLAFIIPILEKLFAAKWTRLDGLGALIITPTRELAYQIFDVLNKVGKKHDFSAGLVIGGTDFNFEAERIQSCQIMICTPGRLLQHMTENPRFVYDNVQVLVLDEADMCLSMGFADSVNCILEELPAERQTLLFSATQTRDVKDLIRAGCRNPVFCSVHEHSKTSTPKSLLQNYVVCEAHDKFNFLWSFITYHKKQKILVFLSTCKQVKYISSMFCKFQPGLSVLDIHGNMKQLKRMAVYDQFCRKQSAVLFATDVASRGLDIPAVHWVVQADCPEDVNTYIHRAGRTARYSESGESLLILTPSEEPAMLANLVARNIPISQIFVDADKQQSINRKMETVLCSYPNLKEDAVRAFKAYIKHVAQMKNKKVFKVLSIDRDAYARSLGLIVTPRVRFLERLLKLKEGGANKPKQEVQENVSGRRPPTTLDFGTFDSDDDDDTFLVSSNRQDDIPSESGIPLEPKLSKKKMKKIVTKEDMAQKLMRKNIKVNTVTTFDDEGNIIVDEKKVQSEQVAKAVGGANQGIDIQELRKVLKEQDVVDKKVHNQKMREVKDQKKQKMKEQMKKEREERNEVKEEGQEEDDEESENEFIDSLPDPDKIYGKNKGNDEGSGDEESSDGESDSGQASDDSGSSGSEEDDSDDEEDEAESKTKFSGKRKAREKMRAAKHPKLQSDSTLDALPMDEQEQLALFLLSGKK